ncbi:MAG: efflux RND transporter periplasmic adaptor subunit, partial [Flavobacteriaceae bacterium]|nr:efflux RND transporter periplasmic adaptor subunit [Flavobacteriaceae bacterium]
MKKSVYLLGLILALVSCAQETPEVSNSTAIENSNLEELNAQKTSYTQQIEELTTKLETVNTAIAALGGSEKRALITAFTTETSLFEHNIEVQANIKTRQNILMYPEFAGRLTKLYVAEGQSVKKG